MLFFRSYFLFLFFFVLFFSCFHVLVRTLPVAAANNNADLCAALVACGAPLSALDSQGRSPIGIAADTDLWVKEREGRGRGWERDGKGRVTESPPRSLRIMKAASTPQHSRLSSATSPSSSSLLNLRRRHSTSHESDGKRPLSCVSPAGKAGAALNSPGPLVWRMLSSVRHPPSWVDDTAIKHCMCCNLAFGPTRRRHHCRHCGGLFCAACSRGRSEIPAFGVQRKVRVCGTCEAVLRSRLRPWGGRRRERDSTSASAASSGEREHDGWRGGK